MIYWLKFRFIFFSFCSLYSIQIQCDYLEEPEIYDCFLFYNELDILEIRLNELYEYVDYFVIVEAVETFRGNPKKLYFEEYKDLFSSFLDMIIHVIVDEHFETADPWEREEFQRNQIMQGLAKCKSNDIVLISDVDEIIRPSVLLQVKNRIYTEPDYTLSFVQNMYRYYLNRLDPNIWFGTIATFYLHLKKFTPEYFRRNRFFFNNVPNGGWHFTWMGGIERIMKKISSDSHTENDSSEARNPKFWVDAIHSYRLVPIDEWFPQFVIDNLEYLTELGLIDTDLRPGT